MLKGCPTMTGDGRWAVKQAKVGKFVIDFRKAKSSDRREFERVGQIGRDFATMESDIGDYDFRYTPYLKYSRDALFVPCVVKF